MDASAITKMALNGELNDGINYDELDKRCIPLVAAFNSAGLKTEFSCQGHSSRDSSFEIIFDEGVSDGMIYAFLVEHTCREIDGKKQGNIGGCFMKWARVLDDKIQENWVYRCDYGSVRTNQDVAEQDFEKMFGGK